MHDTPTQASPACGHSSCSQHWIDTGHGGCVLAQEAAATRVARDAATALVHITGEVSDAMAAPLLEAAVYASREAERMRNAAATYVARLITAREGIRALAVHLHATHAHVHDRGVTWETCTNTVCEEARRQHGLAGEAIEPTPCSAQQLVADLVTSMLVREGEVLTPAVALERANNMACWILHRQRELGDAVDVLIDAIHHLRDEYTERSLVGAAIEDVADAVSDVCAAYDEMSGGGR